jgi:DNA-binding helix-hairpin-helix protein with protein kinase domain
VSAAELEVDRLARHWDQMCGDAAFLARRRELEEARRSVEGLRAVEEGEWQGLAARYRDLGFEDHLKGFVLEFARIPGLGPQEIRTLARAGVSTANDVTPAALDALPEIERAQAQALLLFREVAARSFVFDPVALIPGREQNDLAEAQMKRRDQLAKVLQSGALELAELRRQILSWRDVLGRTSEGLLRRLAQARADLRRS